MQIAGSAALVTGADRGLGQVYARELVSRGAAKVYGAARNAAAVTEPGGNADPARHRRPGPGRRGRAGVPGRQPARQQRRNTGIQHVPGRADLDSARAEMETNYFGTLRMCRAFAPVLKANGGGAIVDMLSVTSFYTNPFNASYGASKAPAGR